MNIVFFGSSNFAVPSLKALTKGPHKVVCVVTQPDKTRGRGLHLQATSVKLAALENGIRIYQPQRVNDAESVKFLKSLNADLFVVGAYGQILSQDVLDIPRIFAINTHASLLPKYRGAGPINWALINGDPTTGVTIIKMISGLDAGPAILSKAIDINESDTAISLEEKLAYLSADLLMESIECAGNNSCSLSEQDESKATFAPKLKKEDGIIEWEKPAYVLYNLIRGCLGWPGAFTYFNGKLLKIYKARVYSSCENASAGEVIKVSREGIAVACGKDNLLIEELQPEGKKRMAAGDFIIGHKINKGDWLGRK